MAVITVDGLNVRPTSELYNAVVGDAGSALEIGDVVYPTSSGWLKADADAAASQRGTIGMVISGASGDFHADDDIASGDRIAVLLEGEVYLGASANMDVTKVLYISGTAGKLDDVAPASSRAVGYPTGSTTLWFNGVGIQSQAGSV